MIRRWLSFLRYYDWILFFAVILLACFGLAALYGIATSFENPNFSNFYKQIVFIFIGLGTMVFFSLVNTNFFRTHAYAMYVGMLALLTWVLFYGKTLRGTTGWIDVVGFAFQPVEFAKIALLVLLARVFTRFHGREQSWRAMLATGVFTLTYFLLVVRQPDFGSAMILFFLWFGLWLASGAKRSHVIGLGIIASIVFVAARLFLFQDFQRQRILTFLDSSADPLGRGYHVRQSTIAIGSGGLLGKGLASGSQSQLKFIPASQTDFIFAVISEELGLVGAMVLLGLYCIIFYRLIRLARRCEDDYAFFLVLGICVILFSHFFINIGMNMGLMPVTGISLPFLSYGGSFLTITFMLIGLAQGVMARSVKYRV